ncbi:hypothetical protein [Acidovorax sp. sic0104]|uniref:hypothetical protein n=1 Tax=Acidovorax sp. sic0104 TaxID=2854784 RepID=UPI001C4764E8|nr:hypothetical protein [Acidovorax sp. sic0104]MBV7542713.1 hypothetical protein [Acidovorax sp. sic0104]
MHEEQSIIVIDLAKEFISLMRKIKPSWRRAFFRFSIDSLRIGSNASYESEDGVALISALKNNLFFIQMNEKSENLFRLLGKEEGVFLLTIDSNFDYKIDFEFNDLGRWKISKMDGETGIPKGI